MKYSSEKRTQLADAVKVVCDEFADGTEKAQAFKLLFTEFYRCMDENIRFDQDTTGTVGIPTIKLCLNTGLCIMLSRWSHTLCYHLSYYYPELSMERVYKAFGFEMQKKLSADFRAAKLDSAYPFNPLPGGELEYMDEQDDGLLYHNTARLQWIKDHLS